MSRSRSQSVRDKFSQKKHKLVHYLENTVEKEQILLRSRKTQAIRNQRCTQDNIQAITNTALGMHPSIKEYMLSVVKTKIMVAFDCYQCYFCCKIEFCNVAIPKTQ